MSKHTNKHWLREKEYYSLKIEYDQIWKNLITIRWRPIMTSSRYEEIRRKFYYKFYNEFYGYGQSAPKHYRKYLNKQQRAKSKRNLYNIVYKDKEICFEDNYKNAAYNYW